MKLFQKLLVAPAALGLLAPMAANAAELNINDVSDYSSPSSELKSISNFSDVYPTDWAHQALSNMVQRHGCVASAPSGSITRYEAAALLNKCLESAPQANAEERRLLNEFAPELAVIKGRVDQSNVESFEAGMFSPTTKISGTTRFTLGGIDTLHYGQEGGTASEKEATVFVYDTVLTLNSSFSGSDSLVTTLRSGNTTSADPFGDSGIAALEYAFDSSSGDSLDIHRNYYQFPIGDDITATVGAKVRQDDMLAVWPSSYPGDSVLDVLTYGGANAAYALAMGPGAGVSWAKDNFSASVLFVSTEGTNADPAAGGVLTGAGSDDITAQLAWVGDGLTVAAAYTVSDGGVTDGTANTDDYEALGLSVDWAPNFGSNFLPSSVSAGFGSKTVDKEDKTAAEGSQVRDSWTWSVGLQWSDFIASGNTLGIGVGSAEGWIDRTGYSDPMAYEMWYSMPVTDNITITPAIFQVERYNDYAVTGGLVKTTFTF